MLLAQCWSNMLIYYVAHDSSYYVLWFIAQLEKYKSKNFNLPFLLSIVLPVTKGFNNHMLA